MKEEERRRREIWLARRRLCVTATDVPKILGLSRFGGPLSVYLDKVGRGFDDEDSTLSESGQRLQEPILRWYADRRGVPITLEDPYTLMREGSGLLGCTLDSRWVEGDRRPVDAKNIRFRGESWGPDGSDVIPDEYFVQLHVQMIVTGTEAAELAVLFSGQDPFHYEIRRDEEIVAMIRESVEEFWRKYVAADVMPPVQASEDWNRYLTERVKQGKKEVIEIRSGDPTMAVIEDYRLARLERERAQAREQLRENELKVAIGEAAGMKGEWGSISWRQAKDRETTDWEKIARELAEREGMGADEFEALVKEHTDKSPGARSFRPILR